MAWEVCANIRAAEIIVLDKLYRGLNYWATLNERKVLLLLSFLPLLPNGSGNQFDYPHGTIAYAIGFRTLGRLTGRNGFHHGNSI